MDFTLYRVDFEYLSNINDQYDGLASVVGFPKSCAVVFIGALSSTPRKIASSWSFV